MIQETLDYVSPKHFYQQQFGTLVSPVLCPFHSDTRASFSFNTETGAAMCHAASCNVRFPHIVAFQACLSQCNDTQAAAKIWEENLRPLETVDRVRLLKEELQEHPKLLKLVQEERCLSVSTIETAGLGYDLYSKRISIPVWIDPQHCAGFRYWLPKAHRTRNPNEPKINHDIGLPHLLFNGWRVRADIHQKVVYFMSSELDALLALQDGYLAVSGMRGEGKVAKEWASYFNGRNVVVAIGKDHPRETESICEALRLFGAHTIVVDWPDTGRGPEKDYTDFRLAKHIDAAWLGQFAKKFKERMEAPSEQAPKVSIPFAEITQASNINKLSQIRAVVSGVDTDHYLVPTRLRVRTTHGVEHDIVLTERDYLFLVDASEDTYNTLARKRLHLSARTAVTVTPTDYIELYRCQLAPDLVEGQRIAEFRQHIGVSIGRYPNPNTRYDMDVIPVSSPRSQLATVMVKAMQDTGTRNTGLTKDEKEELKKELQPLREARGKEALDAILHKVTDAISIHHTSITQRHELHLTVLLTYLCPLGFRMEGRVQRGWMQALVLGDSRTGKSEVANYTNRLLGVGEVISSENTSYMGLVGGLQKQGDRFMLVWGRMPRNHGGHLTIEETSSMSVEEISRLTDIRSSGVARLDKGGFNHKAHACVRQLYLSNPRGGSSMSRSSNAVKLIQKLVGPNEDIARFDIILVQSSEEVSIEQINTFLEHRSLTDPPLINDEAWHMLVTHIWSLEPEQVYLTKAAEKAARDISVILGREFHYEVPIFKAEDGRYKLARIAAGLACMQLHEDSHGRIKVCSWHVEMAADFLRALWTKECFGYDRWSKSFLKGEDINPVRIENIIRETTGSGAPLIAFCDMMSDRENFTVDDLCESAATDRQGASKLLMLLNNEKVIHHMPGPGTRARYLMTPAFRKLLTHFAENKPTKL